MRIENDQVWEKQWILAAPIDVDNSKYSVGKVKVEIELRKAEAEVNWPALERGAASAIPNEQSLKYPSSARKPVSDVKVDLPEEEPTGEAAINALFQKIYANASEDTRRAMMKSFVESKGTVLSTNWDEVGSKHIDPVPPK